MKKKSLSMLMILVMVALLALVSGGVAIASADAVGESGEALLQTEEMTSETLMGAMYENLESVSSMSLEVGYIMEMTTFGETYVLQMDYEAQMTTDPQCSHILLMMAYDDTEDGVFEMEIYTTEDAGYVTYGDGVWYESEIEDFDAYEFVDAYTMMNNTEGYTLAEETQFVGDTACYVLTRQVEGELLANLLATMDMDSLLEEEQYDALAVQEVCYVDEETLLPVQIMVDFGNSLSAVFEELSDGEDAGFFSIDTCTAMITYTGFDNVDSITVPEEVMESAVAYDDLEYGAYLKVKEDGTYVLEDGMYGSQENVAVNIAEPEGYSIDATLSDSSWICFDAEIDADGGYAYVYYTLYPDYTAEEMEFYFGDFFDDFADYYDDVVVTGIQTITAGGREVTYVAVSFGYGDGRRGMEFYAWTEIYENVFLRIGGSEYAYGGELRAYGDLPAALEILFNAVQ